MSKNQPPTPPHLDFMRQCQFQPSLLWSTIYFILGEGLVKYDLNSYAQGEDSALSLYSSPASFAKVCVSKEKKKKASGESLREDQVPGLHPKVYAVNKVPSSAEGWICYCGGNGLLQWYPRLHRSPGHELKALILNLFFMETPMKQVCVYLLLQLIAVVSVWIQTQAYIQLPFLFIPSLLGTDSSWPRPEGVWWIRDNYRFEGKGLSRSLGVLCYQVHPVRNRLGNQIHRPILILPRTLEPIICSGIRKNGEGQTKRHAWSTPKIWFCRDAGFLWIN